MAGQFVVTQGGRDAFYSEEELRRLAGAGQLAVGDLVYHPVLGRWLYAREVEEIRDCLAAATQLGRPLPKGPPVATNSDAVAGFVLGVLGHLPIAGFICCLLGLYFSSRGMRQGVDHRSHSLAIAGLVLSLIFLVPATAGSALFIASLLP